MTVSRAGSPEAVLVLTLVGYPAVAALSMLTGLPNRALSIGMRGVVVALALDVIVRRYLARGRVPFTTFWVLWSGFWALSVSRLLLDGVLSPVALRLPLGEYLLWSVGLCLLPGVAQAGWLSDRDMRRAFVAIITVGTAAILASLWVVQQSGSVLGLLALASGRLNTDTLDPISMGHLGATILILSLWQLLRDDTGGAVGTIALVLAGGVGAVVLVMAASRGPMLAALAVTPLLVVEFVRNRSGRLGYLAKLTLPGAIAVVALVWLWTHRDLLYGLRRVSSGLFEDSARRDILSDAISLVLRHPITGAGTEPLGTYPHNVIIEAFLSYGVLSGALFVSILFLATRAALRVFRFQPSRCWTSLLFVQYLTAGMFSGTLYQSSILWVLSAVAISQASRVGVAESDASAPSPRSRSVLVPRIVS